MAAKLSLWCMFRPSLFSTRSLAGRSRSSCILRSHFSSGNQAKNSRFAKFCQSNLGHSFVNNRPRPTTLKSAGFRIVVMSVGAIALGFSILDLSSEEAKLTKLKMIQCVNALNSDDVADDNDDRPRVDTNKKGKLSQRFNFIADAVETAAPAVVYIQVKIIKNRGYSVNFDASMQSKALFDKKLVGVQKQSQHLLPM